MVSTERADVRDVAVPAEHGGWSLTLEPAALGLIVAPTAAGFALATSALVAFLLRTPLRVVMVDRRRRRRLPRTAVAQRVLLLESVLLVGLVGVAALVAEHPWWPPLIPASLLIGVELWYDSRSRSRRLLPELVGTIGVGAIATAIALAGGMATAVAYGLWLVVACRNVAAVFFVRVQLRRAKDQPYRRRESDLAQVGCVVAVTVGVWAGAVTWAAAAAIAVLAGIHLVLMRRPTPRTAVLGAQQVVFGLTIVLVTGLSVLAP